MIVAGVVGCALLAGRVGGAGRMPHQLIDHGTTPPEERTMLPVVRVILCKVLVGWRGSGGRYSLVSLMPRPAEDSDRGGPGRISMEMGTQVLSIPPVAITS